MERRPSFDIPNNVLYSKISKHLRIVEMVLCLSCLALATYFWYSVNALTGATMIVFTTAFSFFVITLIDVIAGLKNRQYTTPAWIGIAFLGAFMFFLSFGFMAFHFTILYIAIGVVFFITAVAFLLDAILILLQVSKLKFPKKIHPSSADKKAQDRSIQAEHEAVPVSEVPVEMRTFAPRTAAAPARKTPTGSQFPITSYGGTFPVAAGDAAPLPTPDKLTGLEPARSPQLYVPKKGTRGSPGGQSTASSPNQMSSDGRSEFYPQREEIIETRSYVPREGTYEVYSPSERAATAREISGARMAAPIQERGGYPDEMSPQSRQRLTESMLLQHQADFQDVPYQAAGEPVTQPMPHDFRIPPGMRQSAAMYPRTAHSQGCQCCCAMRNIGREQVTPFVTHHYDQSPCICGYTHYQASTVVKGAVRQYPQDSLEEQQKMIQGQLEQMKESYRHQVCSCHDKPTREPKQRISIRDRGPHMAKIDESQESSLIGSSEYKFQGDHLEYDSNRSLRMSSDSDRPTLERISVAPTPLREDYIDRRSISPRRPSNFEESKPRVSILDDTGKRVTIITRDVSIPITSTEASNREEVTRWSKQLDVEEEPGLRQQLLAQETNERLSRYGGDTHRRSTVDSQRSDDQSMTAHLAYRKTMPPSEARKYLMSSDTSNLGSNVEDREATVDSDRRPTILSLSEIDPNLRNKRDTLVSGKSEEVEFLTRYRASRLPPDADHRRESQRSQEPSPISEGDGRIEEMRAMLESSGIGRPPEPVRKDSIDSSIKQENSNTLPYSDRRNTYGTTRSLRSWDTDSSRPERRSRDLGENIPVDSMAIITARKSIDPALPRKESTWASEAQRSHESFVPRVSVAPLGSSRVLDDETDERGSFVQGPSYQPTRRRESAVRQSVSARSSVAPKKTSFAIPEELSATEQDRLSTVSAPPVGWKDAYERQQLRYPSQETQRQSSFPDRSSLEQMRDDDFQRTSVVLPRMEHPIETQRRRQGIIINRDEDLRSHLPFYQGVPQDMMMIRELSCRCVCKCVCTNTSNSEVKEDQDIRRKSSSLPSDIRKFSVPPLNEQPYHPKDDYTLPLTTFEPTIITSNHLWKNSESMMDSMYRNVEANMPNLRRNTVNTFEDVMYEPRMSSYVESVPFRRSSRRQRECLPECPSCPIRRERKEREARMRRQESDNEVPYYEGTPRLSKRGSMKRSYPDGRK